MKPGQRLEEVIANRFNNARFLAPMPDPHIGGVIRDNGGREFIQTEMIIEACEGEGIFLDVGANIGWYTILVPLFTKRNVIAIEPHPETVDLIKQNIRLNRIDPYRVIIVEHAASDKTGEVIKMYEHPESLGGTQPWEKPNWPFVTTTTTRLDDVLGILKAVVGNIGVGKIECQGFEVRALRGLGAVKVETLFIAFAPGMIRGAGDDPVEFREYLESRYESIMRIDKFDGPVPWNWSHRFGRVESEFVDLVCRKLKK